MSKESLFTMLETYWEEFADGDWALINVTEWKEYASEEDLVLWREDGVCANWVDYVMVVKTSGWVAGSNDNTIRMAGLLAIRRAMGAT